MKSKSGFTLIKLLVGIAIIGIIGILSVVVLTSQNSSPDDKVIESAVVLTSQNSSPDDKAIEGVRQVALAYESSRNQTTNEFPATTAPSTVSLTGLSTIPSGVTLVTNTANRTNFCAYATLINTTPGTYYVASQSGVTYRTNVVPTITDCDAS